MSPHVNHASRLMAAAPQYGVGFIVSESVWDLFSKKGQRILRHVGTVTVKGSKLPSKIFSCDFKTELLVSKFGVGDEATAKHQLNEVDSDDFSFDIWQEDEALVKMRKHMSVKFEKCFEEGKDLYLQGKWFDAKKKLEAANNMYRLANANVADGPCLALIQFMYLVAKPGNWQGFRPLPKR